MARPVKVFYCYARADEEALKHLQKQLKLLERQHLIETWHDRQIVPGTDYAQEIAVHLNQAQVIILLVSPDFLESEYCSGKEMARALQLHREAKVRVVPVLLHPCFWNLTPLKDLQTLPDNGKPVSKWPNQHGAWHNVAVGIHTLVTDVQKQGEQEPVPKINGAKARGRSRQPQRAERASITEAAVKAKAPKKPLKRQTIEPTQPEAPEHGQTFAEGPPPITSETRTAPSAYDQHYDKLQDKLNQISFKILIWEPASPTRGIVAEKRRDISRSLEAEQHQCWLGKDLPVPPGASLQDREIEQARDADLTVLLVEPPALGEMHEFCKHEELLGKTFIFYPEEMRSASENWSLDKKLVIGYRNLEYYQEQDITSCHVRTKVLNWVMARRSYRYSNLALSA
jgi:hypothetical protein